MQSKLKILFSSEDFYDFIVHKNQLYGYSNHRIFLITKNQEALYESLEEEIISLSSFEDYILFISFNEVSNHIFVRKIYDGKRIEIEYCEKVPGITHENTVNVRKVNSRYILAEINHSSYEDNYSYVIIDRKNLKTKWIVELKQSYYFEIFEEMLIINKYYEDDVINRNEYLDRSYIIGINLIKFFGMEKVITANKIDSWVIGSSDQLQFSILSNDLKIDYLADINLVGSLLFIKQYNFNNDGCLQEYFWYDIESCKRIYISNDNEEYCKLYNINNKLAVNNENTKLVNWNYELIYECEKDFVINRIITENKDNYYLICENGECIKIQAINKTNYYVKEIFNDTILPGHDIYEYEFWFLDFEHRKELVVYRGHNPEYRYEHLIFEERSMDHE